MKFKNTLLALLLAFLATGCFSDKMKEEANEKFGDQHFKTAISLIELYKVREGHYPASLDSLTYLSDWDKMIYTSVKYERLDDGYALDLVNGWMGKPEKLSYPKGFWKGLGLKRSNLKGDSIPAKPKNKI